MPHLLFIVLSALLLGGCATLSESECRTGDWYAIGVEDGARGKTLDRFGQHREACAKYGIGADIQRYREGRGDGLNSFCRERNGFHQGKAGYVYQDVCPIELEYAFLTGYEAGHNLFRLDQKIDNYRRAIDDRRSDIDYLRRRIHRERRRLDDDDLNESQKRNIARSIRHFHRRISLLQSDIFDLEFEKTRLEFDYNKLNSQHHYY